MGTVRGGRIICDACGNDCTRLHGMRMDVRRVVAGDAEVKKLTDEVDKVYGKHDFIVCWMCTAKSLGIKTLAEQQSEQQTFTTSDVSQEITSFNQE